MAGNRFNTKSKSKLSKVTNPGSNEQHDEPDLALLRKPIVTSVSGFGQAKKIFEKGTEELRSLLTKECDILYECKVCRNLFRSLANFISHKRVYCKQKFSATQHAQFGAHSVDETMRIMKLEEEYQHFLKNNNKKCDDNTEDDPAISKDLTNVIEKVMKRDENVTQSDDGNIVPRSLKLQKIPQSNVAVFQNVNFSNSNSSDSMRMEVTEINSIESKDCAVLNEDGTFEQKAESEILNGENVIHVSDEDDNIEDESSLECKECKISFATVKTLKFHMKYKHIENRKVYPCPDCMDLFSTSWSVYRHLFKVHRKTSAQIRRLRESVQTKSFRMNNPPAFFEKRRHLKALATQKAPDDESIDQENQAWMDNMETDSEVPRCGGCGRRFERRAALIAHTQTCMSRTRALRPNKNIHIQVRKDYNKTVKPIVLNAEKVTGQGSKEATPDKDVSPDKEITSSNDVAGPSNIDKIKDEMTITELEESKNYEHDSITDVQSESKEGNNVNEPTESKFIFSLSETTEKENLDALKAKMEPEVDFVKLLCKRCDRKFSSHDILYQHMATHYKWKRYSCKLCNYSNYEKEKMPLHIRTVHKMKGNIDFYASTIKALDASEAIHNNEAPYQDDSNDIPDTSPNSRRESRCSSDSSRYSDNESISSKSDNNSGRKKNNDEKHSKKTKEERESKKCSDDSKGSTKISMHKVMQVIFGDDTNLSNTKDKSEDITPDNTNMIRPMRRPVRKRPKAKHADFEYDLSNLLKLEAESYRETREQNTSMQRVQIKRIKSSDTEVTPTKSESKPNSQPPSPPSPKLYQRSMISMSMVTVQQARAHSSSKLYDVKYGSYPRYVIPNINKIVTPKPKLIKVTASKEKSEKNESLPEEVIDLDKITVKEEIKEKEKVVESKIQIVKSNDVVPAHKLSKAKKVSLIKPECLDILKDPSINERMNEFTKSGMKTKILVIKGPLNKKRNQVGNGKFSFQTIKKAEDADCSDGKSSIVVKVPPIDFKPVGKDKPIEKVVDNEVEMDIKESDSNKEAKEDAMDEDRKPHKNLDVDEPLPELLCNENEENIS